MREIEKFLLLEEWEANDEAIARSAKDTLRLAVGLRRKLDLM